LIALAWYSLTMDFLCFWLFFLSSFLNCLAIRMKAHLLGGGEQNWGKSILERGGGKTI
jgi:hypothetical protein